MWPGIYDLETLKKQKVQAGKRRSNHASNSLAHSRYLENDFAALLLVNSKINKRLKSADYQINAKPGWSYKAIYDVFNECVMQFKYQHMYWQPSETVLQNDKIWRKMEFTLK